MSIKSRVYVNAVAMITPIGANAEMTTAAVRAGINSYKETDIFDANNNKIKISQVPQSMLDESLLEEKISGEISSRNARLLQLSTLALRQLKNSISKFQPLPVFISVSENINTDETNITDLFISNLAAQCGVDLDIKNSRTIATGRAGGLEVIDLAIRYFEVCDSNYLLVGGVDTFHDKNVIDKLLEEGRLNTEGSTDGFVPGEGAVFLLLSREPISSTDKVTPFITEPGFGFENGHLYSSEIYRGDGLSTAVTNAFSDSGFQTIRSVYSSMNGESYFSKEYGVALIRNKNYFTDHDILHPADCFGDLGAAVCLVMIGMACVSIQKKQIGSPYLIYGSSDSALRSAAIVSG